MHLEGYHKTENHKRQARKTNKVKEIYHSFDVCYVLDLASTDLFNFNFSVFKVKQIGLSYVLCT